MVTLTAILALSFFENSLPNAGAEPPTPPTSPAAPTAPAPPAKPELSSSTLTRPVQIRGRLLSGGTFAGMLERWDGRAMFGSFGQRLWSELVATDIKRIFLQVMDRKSGAQWLCLAELLASAPDGTLLAEDALKQAAAHGQSPEQIAAARSRAATALRERQDQEAREAQRRLQPAAPGAPVAPAPGSTGTPPPAPWPTLTPEEQTAATARVRASARNALEVTGIHSNVLEGRFFLVCGDLAQEQLQALVQELDSRCELAMKALGLQPEVNPFNGRALVLALEREDTFRVAAAAVLNLKVEPGQRGALHVNEGSVSIVAWRGNQEQAFRTALFQQAAQGLLYRAVSAAPIPEWAAEGFALWCARSPGPGSYVDQQWRPAGLKFIRQGGNTAQVLLSSTAQGTWPGPNGVGASVGYLVVEFMLAELPQQFGPWIQAIKKGTPWPEALRQTYGTDPAGLALSASTWYRTNDGPPRR